MPSSALWIVGRTAASEDDLLAALVILRRTSL
jgi:hypothetical protein